MKVMILTDLEGPSGVNGRASDAIIGNSMLNPATAQQALVNEVNACCDGLFAAGADDVVVLDGHGGSKSIDIFQFHPRARLMQVGDWRPASYLDGTYDAFIQIGAHAMQSSDGYMCHTFNSHGVAEMRLNGTPIGEIGISGLLAAYFHVPTVLVSGDDAACREAREFFGEQLTVIPTKCGINRYSAVNEPPQEVCERLRAGAAEALRRCKSMPVHPLPEQLQLQVRMMCPNQANQYEMLGVRRLDEVTLLFETDDFVELWAQHTGWAPGVHRKKFGITPRWKHPYTLYRLGERF